MVGPSDVNIASIENTAGGQLQFLLFVLIGGSDVLAAESLGGAVDVRYCIPYSTAMAFHYLICMLRPTARYMRRTDFRSAMNKLWRNQVNF